MVDKRKVGVGGSLLTALAAGAVWLAHGGGQNVDDLGRVVAPVVRGADDVPVPPFGHAGPPAVPRLPDDVLAGGAAEANAVKEGVKQGAETFKSLRAGDEYDRAAVAAGCSVMKAGLGYTATHDDVENEVYSYLSPDLGPDGPYNAYVAGPVGRVVTAITAANELPGGAVRYYYQYCGV